MERSPFPPNEDGEKNKAKETEPSKTGFIEKFLKKKEQKLAKTDSSGEKEVGQEKQEKSRIARFAQQVIEFVRRPEKDGQTEAEAEKPEVAEEKLPSLQKIEKPDQEAPVIEQARGERRFAAKVLNLVMKVVARGEQQPTHDREESSLEPAEDVTHLKEAAYDLDEAIQELDSTLPAGKVEDEEHVEAENEMIAEDENATMSQTADYEGGDWNPQKPPEMPLRGAEKAANVQRKPETAKEKMLQNLAASGLGFLALSSAIALKKMYKKQKREFRELKKFKKKQTSFNQILQGQQASQAKTAQINTAKPALAHENAKSQEQINQLSDFTHKQAEVTRETAQQVRRHQGELDNLPILPVAEKPIATKSQNEFISPEVSSVAQPVQKAERLKPLSTVEISDHTERLVKDSPTSTNSSQAAAATSDNNQSQAPPNQQAKTKQTAADIASELGLPTEQNQTGQPWLLTTALVLVVVVLIMAFLFLNN